MANLPKLGLRREALLFLPITALVLIAVSAFTLVAYRRAIDDLVAERRSQAMGRAAELARQLDRLPLRSAPLRQALGGDRGLALLDLEGLPLRSAGVVPEGNLLRPLGGAPTRPTAVGPVLGDEAVVAGFAPLHVGERPAILRVDLEASILASHLRARRPLTWVVLGVDLALLLLLIQYLRHLLSPIDALLDRARALGPAERPDEDEVGFLLRSFDRALAAMSETGRADSDELGQLEEMLGGSMESGLLLLDPSGEVLALNDVGSALLGIDTPVEGRPASVLLAQHAGLLEVLQRCLVAGEGAQREEVEIVVDEGAHTVGLAVNPLRRNDRSIRGWLILFADLTEVRRQDRERQLSESLSRMGELTAGLAHELRNSLASIRGYLTLIERGDEETLRQDLQEIRREADHLHRVLQDFLSFARPGSAQLESVDLERLAHRAAGDPALAGAAVRVVRQSEQPLPKVQGDPQLLERALRNLLHNAVRAQAEGDDPSQPVEVQLNARGDEVVLEVLDRGPGLAEEVRDHLFVPFASGHAEGTGLGLALSRRIAELHHARLSLENRQRGGVRASLLFETGKTVTKGNDREPVRHPS